TATVVGHRRHIRDRGDADAESAQRAHRGFAARTGTLDFDIEVLNALFNGCATGHFRCHLSSKRSRLARTLETLATRRSPGQSVALAIGDRNDRVVEGGVHV